MKTKIILEFGCNHNGEFDIAIDMIDQASILGVWGVKFQKRNIEAIPDTVKRIKRNLKDSFGANYYEHRKVLEFTKEQMVDLKRYAEYKGLKFCCSVFDLDSLADMVEIGCHHIKLPSQLYTDSALQKELIAVRDTFGTKILVSTGMHNAEEIINNDWLKYADIIFHCISIYPCQLKEMNIIFIQSLKKLSVENCGFAVGYSSHDELGVGIKYAVMAGAEYIERHFTLDKTMKGSDHLTVSSDVKEMERIISDIKMAEEILGVDRVCSEKEKKIRQVYRGF